MKKFLVALFVGAVSLAGCQTQQQPAQSGFVKVTNGHFEIDGKPYYYVGTNFWFGAILGSQGEGGNRERLIKELDFMKANGIDNLRVLVGADGPNGVATKVEPTLQIEPGVYNDSIFDGLDFLMVEMAKRKMYAVLYLNNSWEWSGGYGQYLNWIGCGEIPIPKYVGGDVFMEYVSQYAKADEAHKLFENHIQAVVGRTNRYSGLKYADDPAIMSWQIGNEPRAFGKQNKEAFAAWVARAAQIIKTIDPNHLVSVGSEGAAGCEGDIELWANIHSDSNIDYSTIHIWPNNWGWIDKKDIPGTIDVAIEKSTTYISEHLAKAAATFDKPVVLEEFGLPRDMVVFESGTPTVNRDKYYQHVFGVIEDAAANGGAFHGCNFWAWGGFAQPQHIMWEKGDDYMGDPAQEEQGLNSVYASDSSTINMINQCVKRLEAIVTGK